MSSRVEQSKVLLTGASGGIGHAIARALHGRGASLTLTARRADVLEGLRNELGDGVDVVVADLADSADLARLCELTDHDVLVANAALPASGRYDSFTGEEIDRAIDVNLRAPIQLCRALAPAMEERGRGHLVLVSSLSGKVATPGSSVYGATKFGLRGFGFAMNEDLTGTGVGVTSIFPGFIREAGMFHDAGVKLPKGVGTRSPDDVAAAVIEGIEKGKVEIDVAPISLRSGGWLFGAAPSAVGAIQRRLGGNKMSRAVSHGQRDKR